MTLHHASSSFRRGLLAVTTLLLVGATPAVAQDQAKLRDDFQRLRRNVLGMVDAMPASGLRTAPTEGVRDFAQQIEHIAAGAVNIITRGVDADGIDLGMDPEVYLNDKAALSAFVEAAFDRIDTLLAQMSPEELRAPGSLFGQLERPRWMIVQVAHEHGVWTLGATVPYLRMNGAAPPGYNLVPGVGGE